MKHNKKNKQEYSTILIILGAFLIADGLLSLYWGIKCLESCFNNSDIGNIIRILRALTGLALIIMGFRLRKK